MDDLRKSLRNGTDPGKRAIIKKQVHFMARRRAIVKDKVTQIIARASGCNPEDCDRFLNGEIRITKHACYKEAVKHFNSRCFEVSRNTYVLKYMGAFINMCEEGVSIQDLRTAMDQ
ncbi:unnamed protein product, partial [Ixodes hexagonus]